MDASSIGSLLDSQSLTVSTPTALSISLKKVPPLIVAKPLKTKLRLEMFIEVPFRILYGHCYHRESLFAWDTYTLSEIQYAAFIQSVIMTYDSAILPFELKT
jgi:hypothetical protein